MKQTIFRTEKPIKREPGKTILEKKLVFDSGLSLEGLGLISSILSLEDDNTVITEDFLFGRSADTKETIHKILNELVEKGYAIRETHEDGPDTNLIYEDPELKN